MVGQTGARFGGTAGRRSRAAVEPSEQDDAATTGVRLPSILSRWRRNLEEQDHEPQDPEQQAAEATGIQPPAQQAELLDVAQPEVTPPVPEPDCADVEGADEVERPDEAAWGTSKETYDLVRPYSWTQGRTASTIALAVETLVSATGRPPDPVAGPEHRKILGLCAAPRSVAELAAMMSMPLGVVRVLLGDLAAAGSVAVHRTVGSADAAPDVALMQRVLAGLQRL